MLICLSISILSFTSKCYYCFEIVKFLVTKLTELSGGKEQNYNFEHFKVHKLLQLNS